MRRSSLLLLMACAVAGCGTHINRPPDPGTPWPAAHNGTFVSGKDSLFFNGDGESIFWHFEQAVDNLTSKGEGTYVFQFRNEAWRYDAAEKLKLMPLGGETVTFTLSRPATEDSIYLQFGEESRTFSK